MDTAIAMATNEFALTEQQFELSPVGLVVSGDPTYEEWEIVGQQLGYIDGAVHWWIGDWLNYGEQRWGEMYAQAMDETGFEYQTVANDKWIASKINFSRRREKLSFMHHGEVASLEPDQQTEWLDLAEQEGWSAAELRQQIKRQRSIEQENIEVSSLDNLPQIALASWDKWLPSQPDCDLLITDPPYMTDIDDINVFAQSWLPIALSKVKNTGRAYVCIGAYPEEIRAYLDIVLPEHIHLQNVLVWTYRNTLGPSPKFDYKLNWQAILYYRAINAEPLNCPKMTEQFTVQDINAPDGRFGVRYHKWQKPDELGERLIRHSTENNNIVLDPFAGTGTFLLVASKLGRVAYGCDIDPTMIDLAVERGCERV